MLAGSSMIKETKVCITGGITAVNLLFRWLTPILKTKQNMVNLRIVNKNTGTKKYKIIKIQDNQ